MKHPQGRIVIDDGRRFLQSSRDTFDIITIDPPPPLEAAGSSLLYSTEFYDLVKSRLNPGGLLQQWTPPRRAAHRKRHRTRARRFVSACRRVPRRSSWRGTHFTASMTPIRRSRRRRNLSHGFPKPPDAIWWSGIPATFATCSTFMRDVLKRQVAIEQLLIADPAVVITDDRPFNEYLICGSRPRLTRFD